MRVLSQAEIDAMLAKMLNNPSILPDDAPKADADGTQNQTNNVKSGETK